MGRKSKLKQQRKTAATNLEAQSPKAPQGDIDMLNHLGYGEHNRLRSPEIPKDRNEPQL